MIICGLVLPGQALDLVEVDQPVLLAHAVLHRVEPLAREVRRRPVGQVSAGRQRHAKDGVAGLEQRQHDRLVGLRAGVRLHVGEGAVRTASWPGRSPGSRPRRRTRSRRSSDGPDSPRRTCWSAPSPAPRAPRGRRCSRWRSARSDSAGGPARRGSPPPNRDRCRADASRRRRRAWSRGRERRQRGSWRSTFLAADLPGNGRPAGTRAANVRHTGIKASRAFPRAGRGGRPRRGCRGTRAGCRAPSPGR